MFYMFIITFRVCHIKIANVIIKGLGSHRQHEYHKRVERGIIVTQQLQHVCFNVIIFLTMITLNSKKLLRSCIVCVYFVKSTESNLISLQCTLLIMSWFVKCCAENNFFWTVIFGNTRNSINFINLVQAVMDIQHSLGYSHESEKNVNYWNADISKHLFFIVADFFFVCMCNQVSFGWIGLCGIALNLRGMAGVISQRPPILIKFFTISE